MGYLINYNAEINIAKLRLVSLLCAIGIVFAVIIFLSLSIKRNFAPETAPIMEYSAIDIKLAPAKIIPPMQLEQLQQIQKTQNSPQPQNPAPNPKNPRLQNLNQITNSMPIAMPKRAIGQPSVQNSVPNIFQNGASSQNSRTNGVSLPNLEAATWQTIFEQECEKADPQDRPLNCPTNAKVKRIVEINNGPRYRPERVQGYRANEVNAKYFAGWRERCQTNEGAQATVCIPFGKKPPRVKTPQELCLEQGLSHCNGVPMPKQQNSIPNQ